MEFKYYLSIWKVKLERIQNDTFETRKIFGSTAKILPFGINVQNPTPYWILNINRIKDWEMILSENETNFLVKFLMDKSLLVKEFICEGFDKSRSLSKYNIVKDNCACRRYASKCPNKKKYFWVQTGSFFEKFTISLKVILKIILRCAARQPIYSI